VIEGNAPASDNDWETVKKGGDTAIQKWIDDQISGRSCAIVLIGSETAGRKWINYEIGKAWNEGKGVVGVHIHKLKNSSSQSSTKGANPFERFTMKRDNAKLSTIVKTYDPVGLDSSALCFSHLMWVAHFSSKSIIDDHSMFILFRPVMLMNQSNQGRRRKELPLPTWSCRASRRDVLPDAR